MGEPKREHSVEYVVGIGSSAGGLDALEKFFRKMPADSGMAFVLLQHLSPDYKSMMVELLSKHTRMQVVHAQDGLVVKPNTVYTIPPKTFLQMSDGKLVLSERVNVHTLNLPIDVFFRSLAEEKKRKAIGIVLSGTGSDGTMGSRAIKEAGGMIMVQKPSTAQFDGMPKSAIATGVADYVIPPGDMATELLNYIKHASNTSSIYKPATSDESKLGNILSLIYQETGLDFSFYKQNTVLRRIERRMGVNQIDRLDEYIDFMRKNPSEIDILYNELLIGVTRFFRDQEAFDIIKHKVLPELEKMKKDSLDKTLRIWVTGCSTGEEVYSLAILLSEYFEKRDPMVQIKIFATDIDKKAIEIASQGKYPSSIVADLPMEYLSKYFFKDDDYYQVVERLRKMVIFAKHNLIKDPPFNKIDLITCRNLLIYLKPSIQNKILSMFGFTLRLNGFMFLGSSESIGDAQDIFSIFDSKWKIYRYRGGATFKGIGNNADRPDYSGHALHTYKSAIPKNLHTKDSVSTTIRQHIFNRHMDPTVIVDANLNVIDIVVDVSDFLHYPVGQVTYNITKMASSKLAMVISTAVRQAKKKSEPVLYKDVNVQKGDQMIVIDLQAEPFIENITERIYYIITFIEKEKVDSSHISEIEFSDDSQERLKAMELELQLTRENLQATIEELETSNEELQATNEELMSANEELQSTNEELQSVNEELYTVNAEYQNKIEELTSLNNDINNFLASTNIGTIFLTKELKIRLFTPPIKEYFNIVENDIGRPIHHFSNNLEDEGLIEDMKKVLKTEDAFEKTILTHGKRSFLMRIMPYWTLDNTVEGIVLTFVDITDQRRLDRMVKTKDILLRKIVDLIPYGVYVKDQDGKYLLANQAHAEYYGKRPEQIIGQSSDDYFENENDKEKFKKLDREIIEKNERVDLDHVQFSQFLGRSVSLSITKVPFTFPESNEKVILGITRDLIDCNPELRISEKICFSNLLVRALLSEDTVLFLVIDPDRKLIYQNSTFQTYTKKFLSMQFEKNHSIEELLEHSEMKSLKKAIEEAHEGVSTTIITPVTGDNCRAVVVAVKDRDKTVAICLLGITE